MASRRRSRASRSLERVGIINMIIVLIHWFIKSGSEPDFLRFWSERTVVKDKSGLIGELLSKVGRGASTFPVTWHLDTDNSGDAIHYVNVGIWDSEESFTQQIAIHFNDDGPILKFEQSRRRRLLLRPQRQRIGEAPFPAKSSDGVV